MITIGHVGKTLGKFNSDSEERDAKRAFAVRINKLCNEAGIPPKGKNRQRIIGDRFSVSQRGARKWLEGEGFPELGKCIEIANSFNVCVEWLLTGRGPKHPGEKPRLAFTREEVAAARKVAEIASTYTED